MSNYVLEMNAIWNPYIEFFVKIYVGFVAEIDIKILGVPPPGLGMPFLDHHTCAEGGLFISARVDVIHGWMTRRMDGRDEKASRRTTTTSFNIWGAGEIVTEITREKILDGDGDGWIDRERKPDPRGMEIGLDAGWTTLVPLQVEDSPSGAWMPGRAAGAGGPTSDLISSSSSTVCFFSGWHHMLQPASSSAF